MTTDRTSAPPISNAIGWDGGLDVEIGVTKGLMSDVTVNTDFAQVEVDEQQVNLTRFNVFFAEKRDFFLAGIVAERAGHARTRRAYTNVSFDFLLSGRVLRIARQPLRACTPDGTTDETACRPANDRSPRR